MRHSEYYRCLLFWTFHVHLPALCVILYFVFPSLCRDHKCSAFFVNVLDFLGFWEHFFLLSRRCLTLPVLFTYGDYFYFSELTFPILRFFLLRVENMQEGPHISFEMADSRKASSIKFTFLFKTGSSKEQFSRAAQQRNPHVTHAPLTQQNPAQR